MSKLTGRKSKKTDPPTKDGYIIGGDYIKKSTGEKITGESTGPIKVDEQGIKYVEDINNPSDTTHLRNIGPIPQKYSSMKSMGQAVAKWTSPHKLTGKVSRKEQDKESVKKYGVAGSSKRTEKAKKSIAKDEAKAKKKEYKESDEGKEATAKKKADASAGFNEAGKMLQLFATGKSGETATERKKKAKSEEEKREKTKSAGPTFEEQIEEKPKTTTESDEGKKDVIKVDSSTASTASTERKGSPLTLQNLGPEVETKKKRGINPAAAALGGAALGGLAVHLINKKKNAPTERKGEPKKGGKAKAISKTPKKPVSGRRPK